MDLFCMFLCVVVFSIQNFVRKKRALKAQSHQYTIWATNPPPHTSRKASVLVESDPLLSKTSVPMGVGRSTAIKTDVPKWGSLLGCDSQTPLPHQHIPDTSDGIFYRSGDSRRVESDGDSGKNLYLYNSDIILSRVLLSLACSLGHIILFFGLSFRAPP